MKICNIVPFFAPHFGGVVDRCYHITKELARRGHSVTLCTSEYQFSSDYASSLEDVNIRVFRSYMGRFCVTPSLKSYLQSSAKKYDVFHLMNNYSYVNMIASNICYQKEIPYMYSAMGSLPVMSRSFIRKFIFNRSVGKNIVQRASKLCAITQQELEQYLSYNKKVNSEKICKIPNAIEDPYDENISGLEFRNKFNIPENKKIILYVGRLEYVKGIDILIRAFEKLQKVHPDILLVIVGPDFGEKQKLESLIKHFKLESKIIFTGPLYNQDKSSAYAASHMLVVPSRWENMSIVALEAAAWSLPIVITQTSGFPEIETEKAGYSVRPEIDDIANGIKNLLDKDDKYFEMKRNARNMVINHYLWNKVGEKMEQELLSILRQKTNNKEIDY